MEQDILVLIYTIEYRVKCKISVVTVYRIYYYVYFPTILFTTNNI